MFSLTSDTICQTCLYGVYGEEDYRVWYLSGSRWFEGEDVGQSGDDVDGEANEKWSNGGVDGTKEWEDDGEEPYGDDHRQSCCRTLAEALALMHPYGFFPHKV